MELNILFSVFVLTVGALHLVWKLSAFINRHMSALAKKRAYLTKPVQRFDWYVFFHCSDLTNVDHLGELNIPINKRPDKVEKDERPSVSRRPELRRYFY